MSLFHIVTHEAIKMYYIFVIGTQLFITRRQEIKRGIWTTSTLPGQLHEVNPKQIFVSTHGVYIAKHLPRNKSTVGG